MMNSGSPPASFARNSEPILLGSVLLLAIGCKHLRSKTVAVDRFDYSATLADSSAISPEYESEIH